ASVEVGGTTMLSVTGLPGAATGTVDFAAGGSTLCTATLPDLSCQPTAPAIGTYDVTATYSGDVMYAGATASTSFEVTGMATTITASADPASVEVGGTTALSVAGLPGAATGTVAFTAGGSTLCTATLPATTCTTGALLAAGTHEVTATYSGDATYAGATATTSVEVTQGSAGGSGGMGSGETLTPGQSVTSPSGQGGFEVDGEGHIAAVNSVCNVQWLYQDVVPAAMLIMQADGNLVAYDAVGNALWWSGTWGNPGATMEMMNDGNAVIFSVTDDVLWESDTTCTTISASPGLPGYEANVRMNSGDQVWSADGQYVLLMQADGNLVEYRVDGTTATPVRQWGTYGHPGAFFVTQGDGNLVIYGPAGEVLWQSRTYQPLDPGSLQSLVVQHDGNVVLYSSGTARWWSGVVFA
ncbi:MAG: Ig-like domain repeat protein, partial [Actinomycetales bacterium]